MTKKIIFFSIFIFLVVSNIYAYTEKKILQDIYSGSNIGAALIKNQAWVPYPDYNNRHGWDQLMGSYKSEYIKKGEEALKYNWKIITATDYLEYERTGARTTMETPYDNNNRAIVNLLMAELAEGKGRFIDHLVNGIFYSCEMTSWSIAAHQVRQSDGRSLPLKDEHIIELASGDMGSVFSWIYYFLHEEFDKINPTISRRLRAELEDRILQPFLKKDFWWMGFNYHPGMIINNWNVWCNFNVLQCFLLLENDEARLTDAVVKTMKSVDQFLNYSKIDGACEEGPSYWGHAAGKLYDYLQLLYDGTGGNISIFNLPMIKDMGEYISKSYVGNGWVVNFADASAKQSLDHNLIFRYGKAVGSNEMMGFANYLSENRKDKAPMYGRDLFRTLQSLLYHDEFLHSAIPFSPSQSTWYPETEFCYMSNKNGFFVATKGGYNNESHNHNDIGTFSLYLDTTPVFIDAGVGTYTRQTFSSERYSIWTMQSNWHNLPLINGAAQSFGTKYKATDVKFNPTRMQFSANIATAYPEDAGIKQWTRAYTLGKNELKIEDRFDLDNPETFNQINFLTWGDVDISRPGEVIVKVENLSARLSYDKNIFTPVIETVTLDDPRLSNVWGKEIYRVSLHAKKIIPSGTYKYTIHKIK